MARIYLIDDHPIVRAGLSALLQGAGHTIVGEGEDITQALSEVNRLGPDVLMLDLHLDGRSGFEVLAEMQRRQLSTRVIVLSMSDQPRNVAEALRMGASGYVLKGSASTSKPDRPSRCRSSITTSGASRLTSDSDCVMSWPSPTIEWPAPCSSALSPARTIG